jgi:nucleoside-diphosphate-sugar epimerase
VAAAWEGKRVLVTGAGGFIGSHLAGRLTELGADVRAFLRYTSERNVGMLRHEPARGDMELAFGDLRDPDSVRAAVEDCDLVFHLGALIGIPYSYEAPREVLETNVLGTLNVLRAAGTARVVCTSTSEIYGTPESLPITEAERPRAQSPYAASKIGADALVESMRRSHGVQAGILRPFNTYGPRQSLRAIVPTILAQALAGGEVRLGSLEPMRDLTYVADTVDGFIRFAELPDFCGRTIQLGSGQAVTIGELVQLTERVTGRTLDVVVEQQRVRPADSEIGALVSDPSTAAELLGWRAQTDLLEGLQSTADWIAAHPEDYVAPEVYAR